MNQLLDLMGGLLYLALRLVLLPVFVVFNLFMATWFTVHAAQRLVVKLQILKSKQRNRMFQPQPQRGLAMLRTKFIELHH